MNIKFNLKSLLLIFILGLQASCGFKISSSGSNLGDIISGTISPLIGSIAENQSSSFLLETAIATACADPVYAKLFAIQTDGSINENTPLNSQLVGSDARYSFDMKSLGVSKLTTNVQYIVKVEGCNGDVYKRPVTNFDSKQDVDAKSTVVAEVVNANNLLSKTLNEVPRTQIELLINSISGNSTSAALTSLTTQLSPSTQFTEIFGSSPSVILNARPEVNLTIPPSSINELAISNFQATVFHIDPNYSTAYVWKLDGVVKSTSSSWSYIPTANESGNHSIDLYIGRDNGSGDIDLTKPYFTKSLSIAVNNNMIPTPPNFSLNITNPSPVNSNTVLIDLATGMSLANCSSFSQLAVTDTPVAPGIMQFNIDCNTFGTQTQSVTFASGDGNKTLYLWAIDNEGTISSAKTISLTLDTQPPLASLSFTPSLIKGGSTQTISFTASDTGVGLKTLDLYFSSNGGISYSLLTHLANNDTSYSWTVPNIDTTNAKIKFIATDLTNSATTNYSNIFTIDSTAPSSPTIARTSSAASNSTTIALSVTCSADYDKIFFSQLSTTPNESDANWELCNASKSFSIAYGDGLKTIYAFTKDAVGNISSSSNVTMTLDTTAPTAPVANLASSSISSSSTVNFTISDCLDRPSVLVSESMIAPLASDSNWQMCTTSAAAITYTLVGPILQGTHNLYIYAKDTVGNISTATAASIIYDTIAPTLNLTTTLGTIYKSGDTIILNFAGNDANGLVSLKLYYSLDDSNYSLISNLSTSTTSYSWIVPGHNSTNVKLQLIAIDNALSSNATTVESSVFTIDSTPPSNPVITRSSVQYSLSNSISINTTCLADYYQILYSETSTTPSLTNPNWENCQPTKFFTTATGDGGKTIYAYTRDLAGNVSTSSSVTMTLDTTLPNLTLNNFNSGGYFQGGSSQNISWTSSDTNLTSNPITISYSTDGTTYTTIANNLTNSGSYTWTLPLISNTTVTLKLAATDLAGNIKTVTSNNFAIDSTSPTISSFILANGTSSVALPSVSLQISANDLESGVTQMRLSENSVYSNDNWQTYSASNSSFNLSMTPGMKNVYLWLKDSVGNISNSISSSITLDIGSPPVISIISPVSSNTTYSAGDNIHIEWSCTSTNGLDSAPARIKYTTDDGVTFVTLTSWLTNNLTSSTGSYEWNFPSGISVFRLLIECKSAAGVVSSNYSAPLNTGGWSVFAGDPSNMSENVSATLALMYKGSSGFQTIAVDKLGNIFFAKNNLLMKVDYQTGLVTRFAGNSTTNSCSMQAGSDPLNSSYNQISNGFTIFGMNADRDSLIIGACSKVWLLNSTTRALSILNNNSAYNGSPWFFSKTGNLFYATAGFLYKLDLTNINQAPVKIMGTGTCSNTTSPVGSDAITSNIPGTNANVCTGETYVITNNDDSKIWIGCWNGTSGCQNNARIDWDTNNGKYLVGSTNVGWGSQDWDLSWCTPSLISNRVWCSSRHSSWNRSTFDTQLQTWTKVAFGKQIFIRYAASSTGMVSLSSDNFLTSYAENNDGTITSGVIGGSNIETYGNGSDFTKIAFGGIEDITYSSGLNSLLIDTKVTIRKINFNTTQATTLTYSGYLNRLTVNNAGNRLSMIYSCSGNLYLNQIFDGINVTGNAFTVMARNTCGATTYDTTYPLASGSPVSTRIDWIIDSNRRPLSHTNGKFYFSTADATGNNVLIYSSNGTTLNIIAGTTGVSGYSLSDSGNNATTAKLTNVRAIFEVPSGKPNAGDLIIVDNNLLRLITITTEAANPKIYDLVSFALASGYGANSSNTFTDVIYDFNSELLNGSSEPVLGTGITYYVTSAKVVRKFMVTSISGNIPQTATDTAYSFNGTTLSGDIRLSLTPAGLLVTQPSKNRILRVAP